jgi:hypothetical protein
MTLCLLLGLAGCSGRKTDDQKAGEKDAEARRKAGEKNADPTPVRFLVVRDGLLNAELEKGTVKDLVVVAQDNPLRVSRFSPVEPPWDRIPLDLKPGEYPFYGVKIEHRLYPEAGLPLLREVPVGSRLVGIKHLAKLKVVGSHDSKGVPGQEAGPSEVNTSYDVFEANVEVP